MLLAPVASRTGIIPPALLADEPAPDTRVGVSERIGAWMHQDGSGCPECSDRQLSGIETGS